MANQPVSPLEHAPCLELAEALRSRIDSIIQIWSEYARQVTPQARDLPFEQLIDNLPAILRNMADALALGDGEGLRKLADVSPAQEITRFHQNFDVKMLMREDRILRKVIIEQVGMVLARPMTNEEQIALHMCIDEMLQHAIVAFDEMQNARIRSSAESELKYLSFLSHDLNNNLGSVTLFLEALRKRLETIPEMSQDVEMLAQTQESILNTITGMQRLLQNERLRKSGAAAKAVQVNLLQLASKVRQQMSQQAEHKGLKLEVDVPTSAIVHSDGELITLALQNLIGNALKYSVRGVIRVAAEQRSDHRWAIAVADQGPGIARQHLVQIFEAFKRGESHGQDGVGLGLAIVSMAARMLGAEVTVESDLGTGSTFRMILPAQQR